MDAKQTIAYSFKKAIGEFVFTFLSGLVLSAICILLMDAWLKPLCNDAPNYYFWKCTSSLIWHLAFGIIFPLLYFVVAMNNVTKYLFFYIVQQIIAQKEKNLGHSILNFLQEKSNNLYLRFTKITNTAGLSPESVVQRLLNYGSEKVLASLKPSHLWLYLIVGLQVGLLVFLFISNG